MKTVCVLLGVFALSFAEAHADDLYEFDRKSFDARYKDYGVPYYRTRDHFDFSGYKGYDYVGYSKRRCQDFKYFSSRNEYCPNSGYGGNYLDSYNRKDRCYPVGCNYWARYGSTRCTKQVKLMKPYWFAGRECEYSGKDCGRFGGDYGGQYNDMKYGYSDSEYGHGGDDYKRRGCECQTIWCMKKIYTVYETYGKYMKGYVSVKVPCKCDCRRKWYGGY